LIHAAILSIIIATPITLEALTHQQTINFQGTNNNPNTKTLPDIAPTPTPTPNPSQTVKFSLWFCDASGTTNKTQVPTTINNLRIPCIEGRPNGVSPQMVFLARNDGNIPINITGKVTNINYPSNLSLQIFFQSWSGGLRVLQPGESQVLCIVSYFGVIEEYTPGATFNYAFDVVVTANQV
jgi:hypothetical protein